MVLFEARMPPEAEEKNKFQVFKPSRLTKRNGNCFEKNRSPAVTVALLQLVLLLSHSYRLPT